jgi:diguanylate cyclase (GGDEF)-like protein/PAS domain S-box-containing protein
MQGSIVDIVSLLMMVLFFGLQQRSRTQMYFRFWFVGWIFVLLSFLVWETRLQQPRLVNLQEAARIDLMVLGLLAFALSFRVTEERVKRTLEFGVLIAIPAAVCIDLQIIGGIAEKPLAAILIVLVLLGQAGAILTIHFELPRHWHWRRGLTFALCVVFCAVMIVSVLRNGELSLGDAVEAQICLCAGVLYAARHGRRSLAGVVGTAGFLGWGALYLMPAALVHHQRALGALFLFWNTPKRFVGFAMILNVSETVGDEKTRLAEKYRTLYDDFRVMYEAHPHPMWIYAPETGHIRSANLAAVLDYGYGVEEFLRMRVGDLELPEDAESDRVNNLLPEPPGGRRTRYRRKDGSVVWVNVVDHIVQYQGMDARLVTARDITEGVKINQDLAWKAQHDELTGLPNRLLLEDRIHQMLAQCVRSGSKAGLLTIDIDHFKQVNDTHGHLVGDSCLKAVASRLKNKIRQIDTLARTGGEEFTGIIGGLNSVADAERVTTMLLGVFRDPILIAELVLPVTVSIGVAIFPDDAVDAETLRKMSDAALYYAKRTGRNRVAFAPAGAAERSI